MSTSILHTSTRSLKALARVGIPALVGVAAFALGVAFVNPLLTDHPDEGSLAPYAFGFGEQVERYDSLADAVESSDLVVSGRVAALEEGRIVGASEWVDDQEVVAVAVFSVTEELAGRKVPAVVRVRIPGWQVQSGLRVMMNHDVPLEAGDEAILLLRSIDDPDADYRLITSAAAIGVGRYENLPPEEEWVTEVYGQSQKVAEASIRAAAKDLP
jgi:hypothetical protein